MSINITINKTTLTYNHVYYVNSITGLDTNDGLSKNTAYKTVTKAYNSCVSGDAIYLIGVSGANYNDFTSAITKQIDFVGDGVLSKISTTSSILLFTNSTTNVNFYRVNIFAQQLFRSSTGSSYKFYNCIIKLDYNLVGYTASVNVYNFYNCVLDARSVTYGFFREDAVYTNCLFIGKCENTAVYGSSILHTCQVNDVFVSSSNNYISGISTYSNLTLDNNYNIGGVNWQNIGIGTNSDGTVANIGVYGGDFSLDFPIKYLIKQNNNYYTITSISYDSITNHNFIPLTLNGGVIPNKSDIETFGFNNLNLLTNNMTVNADNFKPIDKFDNTAELKMYKLN
jgi:hypothetical protein